MVFTHYNWNVKKPVATGLDWFFGGLFWFGPVCWSLRATGNWLQLPVHQNQAKKLDQTRPANIIAKCEKGLQRRKMFYWWPYSRSIPLYLTAGGSAWFLLFHWFEISSLSETFEVMNRAAYRTIWQVQLYNLRSGDRYRWTIYCPSSLLNRSSMGMGQVKRWLLYSYVR